jgi:pantothenate kinase
VNSHPALDALLDRAEGLLPASGRALLGIAGLPGAGKTTLAEALTAGLAGRLGPEAVVHVPMDGFHLADVQLDRLGLRDVKGAPATFDAEGYAALLARLRAPTADTVYAPGFERVLEQPIAAAVAVPPSVRLVVTEGNYLLLDQPRWAAARAALDEVWLVEADDGTRVRRLVERHVAFGKAPDDAAAWVDRSDEANAAVIRARSVAPDLVVRLG